jgi:hypothetical protein
MAQRLKLDSTLAVIARFGGERCGLTIRAEYSKSELSMSTTLRFPLGRLSLFEDGRHRFVLMRDLGFNPIPVGMNAESIANAKLLGLLPSY